MNNGNPYTPMQTPADPALISEQKTNVRILEIANNTFRGIVAFLCFGFAPVFILPKLQTLFEEFGLELPTITQLILQFSHLASTTAILFLPFILGFLAAVEIGLYSIPSGKWKTLLNIVYWLALILVISLAFSSLMIPYNQIIRGLSATIDLAPHLLIGCHPFQDECFLWD